MEDLDNKGSKPRRRTLDLSLAQVAASALAAVVGAVLASQLGVYGTILGAAVVSIGATTGTAVFQHVFRRTGEQFREMTTTPVPVEHPRRTGMVAPAEETQVFDPFDPGGERTRMMARIDPPGEVEAVTVYRGRSNLKPKSWKVYAVTAAIVFALAMTTVGLIGLASGKPAAHLFDSGGAGKAPTPGGGTSAPADPTPRKSTEHADEVGGVTPSPDPASPTPSPHPSDSTSAKPDPSSPSPSSQGSASADPSPDTSTPESAPSP